MNQQQRLTERLISHWKLIKEAESCPDLSKLSRQAIADIWPSCVTIKTQPVVEGAVPKFQFSEVGTLARSLFKDDPTGQYFTINVKVMPAARLIKRVVELTPTSEPIVDEGQFVNEKSKVVKFRSCLVPFGNVAGITHVVVGLSWREF